MSPAHLTTLLLYPAGIFTIAALVFMGAAIGIMRRWWGIPEDRHAVIPLFTAGSWLLLAAFFLTVIALGVWWSR